ncbi:MAG: hypothetical protein L6R40_006839 [Gallowayella cf. fulva]|nr:MAG: hypothetical protein L6R40_006839 [Xanthomendoza cf. fulva]
MPYLSFVPLDNTQPLESQQVDPRTFPTLARPSASKMPITDPTFQHSDEDWTQITQPRLRKRVQNRVSQRKHRKSLPSPYGVAWSLHRPLSLDVGLPAELMQFIGSKVRQQRANSIDTERVVLTPKDAGGYPLNGGPISSQSSSNPGGQQHSRRGHEVTKHLQADADPFHQWIVSDELEYNALETPGYAETSSSWLDYPSPSYSTASSYSIGSPSIATTYAHGSSSYDPTAGMGPVRESYSYSGPVAPLGVNARTSAMNTSYHQPSQNSYYMSSTVSPSPYSTSTDPSSLPPLERTYDRSPKPWDPSDAQSSFSGLATGPPDSSYARQPSFNSAGYYGSRSMSTANRIPSVMTIPVPKPMHASYSSYDTELLSPTLGHGIPLRSSDTMLDHDRYEKSRHRSPSGHKQQRSTRYPSH